MPLCCHLCFTIAAHRFISSSFTHQTSRHADAEDSLSAAVDAEVNALLQACLNMTETHLRDHRHLFDKYVRILMQHKTLYELNVTLSAPDACLDAECSL